MKPAEEWIKCGYQQDDNSALIHVELIKQIQLDAIKEGMTRAADMIKEQKPLTASLILTARDNLTTACT